MAELYLRMEWYDMNHTLFLICRAVVGGDGDAFRMKNVNKWDGTCREKEEGCEMAYLTH